MALSSFIGREAEVTAVEHLLRERGVRLLTLAGPGGVGKTRLALQVASRIADAYPDGVGFFPLAEVRDPVQVLPAIALPLGVVDGDRRLLLERVAAHLGSRRCLLVLDNIEQVVSAAPMLVDLLQVCPGTAILVTSRVPLHVSGERVVPIPPLRMPDPDAMADPADAEAVRLFLARAEAGQAGIATTGEAMQAVAEICRRLDGLPLAIELAAARTALLPISTMLERLTRRLPLLANGPRDQPARLRTMHSAIAWSYDLLAPAGQELYRQLSAFAGGFSLAAAVAVSAQPEEVVLAALELLVDHSLVRAVIAPVSEPRFTMLETIREFGLDQLAGTGEEAGVRERHARFFMDLAGSIGPHVDGPGADALLLRLDTDRANIESALTWLARNRQAGGAVRLGASMWNYWRIRGHLSEGLQQLTRALDLPGDVPGPVRADALWKLGYLEFYLGRDVAAREHLEQAIALFEANGDLQGVATATDALGTVLRFERDQLRAAAQHQRALALRRELGDAFGQSMPLANLGVLALDRGAVDEARPLLEEAHAITSAHGSRREIAHRALNLAQLERVSNQLERARSLANAAAGELAAIGDLVGTATAREVLGRIELKAGNRARAAEHLLESFRLSVQLGLRRDLVDIVELLAEVVLDRDPELAARMLGAADADRAATGHHRLEIDEGALLSAATATGLLGPEAYAAAWKKGRLMSLVAAGQAAQACLSAAVPAPAEPPLDLDTYGLTTREVEVLRLVAAGHTNRAIAAALFISPATAKRHVTNILAKLGLPTRAAAISFALRTGLAPEEPPSG